MWLIKEVFTLSYNMIFMVLVIQSYKQCDKSEFIIDTIKYQSFKKGNEWILRAAWNAFASCQKVYFNHNRLFKKHTLRSHFSGSHLQLETAWNDIPWSNLFFSYLLSSWTLDIKYQCPKQFKKHISPLAFRLNEERFLDPNSDKINVCPSGFPVPKQSIPFIELGNT